MLRASGGGRAFGPQAAEVVSAALPCVDRATGPRDSGELESNAPASDSSLKAWKTVWRRLKSWTLQPLSQFVGTSAATPPAAVERAFLHRLGALCAALITIWYCCRCWASFSRECEASEEFYAAFPVLRYTVGLDVALGYGWNLGGEPQLVSRFDWRFGHEDGNIPDRRRGKDPMTVYAAPTAVQALLEVADTDFDPSFNDRTVVFGHTPELPVSWALGSNVSQRDATVARLRRFFKRIIFQAKDVEVDGVRALPPPLDDLYLRRGVAALAGEAIASASVEEASKPRQVLASWGYFAGFIEEDNSDLASKPPEWNAMLHEARRSRREARVWARSPAAQAAGVEERHIDHASWWSELSKYRFVLSPLGTAITSAKTLEALLVLTVPIVQRGPYRLHDELVAAGFPIVVIDSWDEVTPESLELWWSNLSPRLERFRRHCLTTDGYWRYFTSDRNSCE